MTDPTPLPPPSDLLPPEPATPLSIPPPLPPRKPGFLRRLFTSRKKQQAAAMQNGYLEMVDLIRAIRSHLDRQETVQHSVLSMLAKVPDAMDRQHEVMTMFKQQLENGMENNRRLTDSMGNLNNTLSAMDESQKASSRTVTDLIHRSRESEQLLREVMRRSERRMTALVVFFFLAVVALGFYFVRGPGRLPSPTPAAIDQPAPSPAPEPTEPSAPPAEPSADPSEFLAPPAAPETPDAPPPKKAKSKRKSQPLPAPAEPPPAASDDAPPLGQPDLTLDLLNPTLPLAPAEIPPAPAP